ncbi:MAG: GntR family transcriptional regulator [Paracoccaceae bacterium]
MTRPQDVDAAKLDDISQAPGTLAQRVHRSMKRAILTLDFPPGAVVRKAPICDRLGVSRAPVAEAIARLSTEGLVDVVPQSATRVSYFSMDELREGTFLRQALELATVAEVAESLTDQQQALLTRNMQSQEQLLADNDVSGFYQADEEFHQLLMDFTGYARLPDVAQLVSLQVSRARMLLLPKPGRLAETLEEHRAIYDAVIARRPKIAQDAMREHLAKLMPRIEKLQDERPDLFR